MADRPVCAITGGSRGIGRATANAFADAGFDLALCGRNETQLRAVAEELQQGAGVQVFCHECDLAEPGSAAGFVTTLVQHFSRLDVLVNNAGVAPMAPVDRLSSAELHRSVAVNISAVVESTQAGWASLSTASGGGVVVNVSSLAAVDPFPGFSVYGGTKAFVELYTQAIACEGKDAGIRAYCVRPGAVDTDLLRLLFPEFPEDQRLPPEAVARLILSMCEEAFQFSSGETVTIQA